MQFWTSRGFAVIEVDYRGSTGYGRAYRHRERSSIRLADRLSCPVIFFQGLEDKVVPPAQTERMVQALRDRAMPIAYVAFPDEQHGLHQAQSIRPTLDAELFFYARVFGIRLPERLEPIAIEHLADAL